MARFRLARSLVLVTITASTSLVAVPRPGAAQITDADRSPATTSAEATPPAVALLGDFVAPLRPGGIAIAGGAVLNTGSTPAIGPITLSITGLPPGVEVADLTSTAGGDAAVDWSCELDEGGAECQMIAAGAPGAQPTDLPGESVAPWQLTVRAEPGTAVPPVSPVTIEVRAGILDVAPLVIDLAAGAEGDFPLLASFDVPLEMVSGQPSSAAVTITNLSAEPIAGDQITASSFLPPGALDWTAAADHWACEPDQSGAPLCRYGGPPLEPGTPTPDLVVNFTAPLSR